MHSYICLLPCRKRKHMNFLYTKNELQFQGSAKSFSMSWASHDLDPVHCSTGGVSSITDIRNRAGCPAGNCLLFASHPRPNTKFGCWKKCTQELSTLNRWIQTVLTQHRYVGCGFSSIGTYGFLWSMPIKWAFLRPWSVCRDAKMQLEGHSSIHLWK